MASKLFRKRKTPLASIALEGDGLRYLELSGGKNSLRCQKTVMVAPFAGALKQDMLGDMEALTRSLARLRDQAGGKLESPLAVGLPSRDVMLRLVDMPPLDLEDAREAIRWEFDKHFPLPVTDAAYDLSPLELPDSSGKERVHFLVAACRFSHAEGVMNAVEALGVEVSALEPLNLAAFRAGLGPVSRFQGAHLQVHVGHETSEIILGYRDGGILFRTVLVGRSGGEEAFDSLVREISATCSFARNRFRSLSVDEIVVAGGLEEDSPLFEKLRSTVTIPVVPLSLPALWGMDQGCGKNLSDEGWESSIGLCVRDLQ